MTEFFKWSNRTFGILVLAVIAAIIIAFMAHEVAAHDVFSDLNSPSGGRCCTGPNDKNPDCQRVPAEWVPSVIHEIDGVGWRITLTADQARFFNKTATYPIDQIVPYDQLIAGLASGWGICVWQGKIRCFIGPSNS